MDRKDNNQQLIVLDKEYPWRIMVQSYHWCWSTWEQDPFERLFIHKDMINFAQYVTNLSLSGVISEDIQNKIHKILAKIALGFKTVEDETFILFINLIKHLQKSYVHK